MNYQALLLTTRNLRASLTMFVVLALSAMLALPSAAFAQSQPTVGKDGPHPQQSISKDGPHADQQISKDGPHSSQSHERASVNAVIERAMGAVCFERLRDPLASVPIDEMQARPSLPLNNPEAVAGLRRAERLLPIAKELAVSALRQLASQYNLDPSRVRAATLRIQSVSEISPDVDLRDNASVSMMRPRAINFGTIFLAGLPSDEGMVSVLSHELTHIGDGRQDDLHPLFRLIGGRAVELTGLTLFGRRPEELTCDLVGTMAARALIARTPNHESLARRLARSLEHNCVEQDDTDDEHLSPRNTMRALLALDPLLARDIVNSDSVTITTLAPPATQKNRRVVRGLRRPSLTTEHAHSYHPRVR